jgi:predicted MFS family arabinose efflux permease
LASTLLPLRALTAYFHNLRPQLPRPVWVLETGGVANSLGNGIVIPFLVIYLHDVRGIGLETAGAVVAVLLGIGVVGSPLAGRLVDRIGARTTLASSLALLAAGYGGFPFVRGAWLAFVLAAVAGAGNAGFAPSHSSLLAALTSGEQRTTAYALTRVTDNLGFGIGGLIGGLIATTQVPESYDLLFAVDAGTFLAFMALLAFVPQPPRAAATAATAGGYRQVACDRAFLALLALTALLVTAAYAQVATMLPPYVKDHAAVSEAGIGAIFFVNTLVLVLAQLPFAKALGGHNRVRALATAGAIFSGTSFGVLAAGTWLDGTSAWQVGFLAGPALGSIVLSRSPTALWCGAAAACAVAAAGFLILERHIPPELAVAPGPERARRKAFGVRWRTTMRVDDPLSPNAEPAPHQAPPEASHAGEGRRRTP